MFQLPSPQTLQTHFAAAGYDDVTQTDVLIARKDDGKAWEVILDKGGQLRATVTHRSSKPRESIAPILGRNAMLMTEKRTIVSVLFTLNDASELPAVLTAIEAAVSKS